MWGRLRERMRRVYEWLKIAWAELTQSEVRVVWDSEPRKIWLEERVVREWQAQRLRRREDMPTRVLLMTYGEMEKGRPGEQILRAFGAKYVGQGLCNRLRLMVVDMPSSGMLPVALPNATSLGGQGLTGSLWEITDQGVGRLDGYFGCGNSSVRGVLYRDSLGCTIKSLELEEGVTGQYRIASSPAAHTYIMGDLLQGYLITSNVTRMIVENGKWEGFRQTLLETAEESGKTVLIADPAIGKRKVRDAVHAELVDFEVSRGLMVGDVGPEGVAMEASVQTSVTEILF